ncbi:hypothetical protein HCN44_009447 [Aphidius gifuensis]|uniref:Odorant-binding protein n=1 Tax=Aphidius gifuensis TaxID=684658 RepID=A0A834Y6B7_APHGI|nr:hypothetical protein HCN44_009447 [Aphidius gifuensis]
MKIFWIYFVALVCMAYGQRPSERLNNSATNQFDDDQNTIPSPGLNDLFNIQMSFVNQTALEQFKAIEKNIESNINNYLNIINSPINKQKNLTCCFEFTRENIYREGNRTVDNFKKNLFDKLINYTESVLSIIKDSPINCYQRNLSFKNIFKCFDESFSDKNNKNDYKIIRNNIKQLNTLFSSSIEYENIDVILENENVRFNACMNVQKTVEYCNITEFQDFEKKMSSLGVLDLTNILRNIKDDQSTRPSPGLNDLLDIQMSFFNQTALEQFKAIEKNIESNIKSYLKIINSPINEQKNLTCCFEFTRENIYREGNETVNNLKKYFHDKTIDYTEAVLSITKDDQNTRPSPGLNDLLDIQMAFFNEIALEQLKALEKYIESNIKHYLNIINSPINEQKNLTCCFEFTRENIYREGNETVNNLKKYFHDKAINYTGAVLSISKNSTINCYQRNVTLKNILKCLDESFYDKNNTNNYKIIRNNIKQLNILFSSSIEYENIDVIMENENVRFNACMNVQKTVEFCNITEFIDFENRMSSIEEINLTKILGRKHIPYTPRYG